MDIASCLFQVGRCDSRRYKAVSVPENGTVFESVG